MEALGGEKQLAVKRVFFHRVNSSPYYWQVMHKDQGGQETKSRAQRGCILGMKLFA